MARYDRLLCWTHDCSLSGDSRRFARLVADETAPGCLGASLLFRAPRLAYRTEPIRRRARSIGGHLSLRSRLGRQANTRGLACRSISRRPPASRFRSPSVRGERRAPWPRRGRHRAAAFACERANTKANKEERQREQIRGSESDSNSLVAASARAPSIDEQEEANDDDADDNHNDRRAAISFKDQQIQLSHLIGRRRHCSPAGALGPPDDLRRAASRAAPFKPRPSD